MIQTFLQETAELQPVWAHSQGLTGFGHRVSDLSDAKIHHYRGRLKSWQRELKKIPRPKSAAGRVEQELFGRMLALYERDWGPKGEYVQNPTLYTSELVYGLWYLFLRGGSKMQLLKNCLGRLKGSPKILAAAKKFLKKPPKLWTKIAIDEVRGYQVFLEEARSQLFKKFPKHKKEIKEAIATGGQVARDFLKFLRRDLMARSHGSFAVGEKDFNFLLKTYHGYDHSASSLLRLGKRNFEQIRDQLNALAERRNPGVPWEKQIEQIKQKAPSKKMLLPTYRKEVQRLKGFLRRHDLVSFPDGERLEVIETPVFTRDTIPFAAYVDPPMFSGKNKGTFFVTPPAGKNAKQVREMLAEHNFASLRVTALHEGYPGHHLQFAKQKLCQGTLMKIFNCSSFYEGWALYCEELMYEEGYYDESTRLLQLRDKLWRACRVIIDVGLHTGAMDYNAAVKFLSRETKMSVAGAKADVNWYTMRPTVPQGYLTGMLWIQRWRQAQQEKQGKKFSLKKFHDQLLRYGAVPLSLVAK